MSLMSVGRLFQTSAPLTEKARRPNCVLVRRTTADLVVYDRSIKSRDMCLSLWSIRIMKLSLTSTWCMMAAV